MKIAIITPYYQESRETIERCLASVRQQTIKSDHFLISDGHPQAFLDNIGVRHVKLDVSHGDSGNTPRGIGAQLAISEAYDGVAFLDADNWYDSDHVQVCIESARSLTGNYIDCDYVMARRRLISPDLKFKTEIPERLPRQPDVSVMQRMHPAKHYCVDTNLYYFCPGSYFMIPYWNLMPKEVSSRGDDVFSVHLSSKNLVFAKTDKVTVNYFSRYARAYKMWGQPVPEDAKTILDVDKIVDWYLSPIFYTCGFGTAQKPA